jgi:recombination protein RecT
MAKKTVVRRHSKRLPMSTDLDAIMHEDDEMFMPPEKQPEPMRDVTPAPAEASKRPTRLNKVVEAEPVEHGEVIEQAPATEDMPEETGEEQYPI